MTTKKTATRTTTTERHTKLEKRKGPLEPLHHAIEETIDAAERIHKSTAALPLDILAEVDIFPQSARQIRETQNRAIGRIYRVARGINREVADLGTVLAR